MGRKALFLVVLALWLSSRAMPTAGGIDHYCGDSVCDTHTCRPGYPESHGDGCEEDYGNCPADCDPPYDPCDHPSPVWVTDWGTDQWVGGYTYQGWDPLNVAPWWVEYCQYASTRTVVQHDQQACVSARQADRTVCYHSENQGDRRYEPNHNSCCSWWWCGGTGASCP
jgi:hypothetical protein